MPIATIESWPMDNNEKPVLIKKITEIFTEQGIPAQTVTVLIKESALENWESAGEQHSVKFKDLKRQV
ncbi:MAG: 4-oxalocrotonate tautomerase [Nanoarchaeota archaeon]|nr:4-oxalocrotonate tautomerase [Nanoarchaeota archaeon]